MSVHYPSPGLEAELAYRREMLMNTGHSTSTRRGPWIRGRRKAR